MGILGKILAFIIFGSMFFLLMYFVSKEMNHKKDWLDSHKNIDE